MNRRALRHARIVAVYLSGIALIVLAALGWSVWDGAFEIRGASR